MNHDAYTDSYLRDILRTCRTVAMVGASSQWIRPSNFAMKYLQRKGYRVIPVNPARAGGEILGETVYPSLKDVSGSFQAVDIFRRSEDVGPIADEAIALAKDKGIRVVWMQIGVRDLEAAARAEAAGLSVVMNRCMKIEYGRLSGELSWSGINSRIITSKRLRPI